MNLNEKVKDLKKKVSAKQLEGLQAVIELRDLIKSQQEIQKEDKTIEIINSLEKVETAIRNIKSPQLQPLLEEIKKIKLNPKIKVTLDDLKEIENLLKQINQKEQPEPFDIQELIKLLKKPENAIAVVLTNKERKNFYNALSSIASGFLGGVDTSHLATKEGQEKLYAIRVQTDSGDSNIKYVGEAKPGSLTSEAVWRIRKIDKTTGTIITWANGNIEFSNIYDNRESLVYG